MKTTITELAAQIADGRPQRAGQLERARAILLEHPNAVLIEVADERTGVRFGKAKCRVGQCEKIGGARQPQWYQIWASWAEHDTR